MANWRKLAVALTVADGKIDAKETNILRKELFADKKIDREELEFLNDLRNAAKSYVPAFMTLFSDGVKANILADGAISDAEAKWLRKAIFADGKVDNDEKKLLKDLRAKAKKTCPSFEKLCHDAGV